jgi:hypothetical protein
MRRTDARQHGRTPGKSGKAAKLVAGGARRMSAFGVMGVVLVGMTALAAGGGTAMAMSQAGSGASAPNTWHWIRPAGGDGQPQANETTASATYAAQYGFFAAHVGTIAADELARLAVLVPFARVAASRVNSRYGAHLQPELVLWWTHAEGIRGRINYSNCANEKDQYFTHIHNCDHPSFWQLGAAGDQFSYVVYLREAVEDMYGVGASDNTALIQQLGQHVLNFDSETGTTPHCGGYSCAFPSTTVVALMQGVTTDHQTDANWYASVLMRDPGVGAWMTARALRNFSRDQTRGWVGCYYAASCWQRLSDRLGDVLAAWPGLVRTAQSLPYTDPPAPNVPAPNAPAAPTSIPTATPTDTPAPTDTPVPTATTEPPATPTDTPATPTAPAAPVPTDTPTTAPTDPTTPTTAPTDPTTPAPTPTDTPGASPTQPTDPSGVTPVVPVAPAPPGPLPPIDSTFRPDQVPSCLNCLRYGGGQVAHYSQAYLLFWLPQGASFLPSGGGQNADAAFEQSVARYFADLNGSDFYKLVTQYGDKRGRITPYVAVTGATIDTTPYPHSGTTGSPLRTSDIAAAVSRAIAAHGWKTDVDHEVFVFTGYGVQSCDVLLCSFPHGIAGAFGLHYCGYHSSLPGQGGGALYAYLPDVPECQTGASSSGGANASNGGAGAAGSDPLGAVLSVLSHEQFESVTDPYGNGWLAFDGEIGDKCETQMSDVALNGHAYHLQMEWSNRAHACATA